jgi:hypothetical protein
MTTTPLPLSEREKIARAALDALGNRRSEAAILHVNCEHSHHLATVFDTPEGPVYLATVHGRSHGRRDREDTPHRPHDEALYVDLLAPPFGAMADDALPAWCDCGQRSLSRAALEEWIGAGERRVVVD